VSWQLSGLLSMSRDSPSLPFDANELLAGEKVFHDRATVLKRLGVFHEPENFVGRVVTAPTHPVTMGRIALRMPREY
jgi:hypothetical protein